MLQSDRSIEDFFNPKVLRHQLISASLYVLFYESFKEELIDKLKFYYSLGSQETDDYKEDVKSRNKSPIYATLDWFKYMGAIDEVDLQQFEKIKKCRNKLSHELHSLIGASGLPDDFDESFALLLSFKSKIYHWWIINVEVASDPEYMGKEINPDDFTHASTLMDKMMIDIALGTEEESNQYLKMYQLWSKNS
ncbi:hypothetical protein [Shewanella sp.]|uniref:hypothetical protein n=1 Tax=Shewanella sp. TaxID=50422 RepID=UPI001EC150FB|nr:hypothetical protein [Shewanella sp.]NRB24461.1 hypothetical protein [Shewanella sp.]